MVILGHQLGSEIAHLLGLPKHTVAFTLHCAAGDLPTVECKYYPEALAGADWEAVLAQYDIVRRDTPKPIKSTHFDAWMAERKQCAHLRMLREHEKLSRMDARLFRHG